MPLTLLIIIYGLQLFGRRNAPDHGGD